MWIDGVLEKYPPELLDKRITTEGNVIGLIYNDPLILDECNLSSDDFLSTDGRFYYEVAREFRQNKINEFTEVAIMSHLDAAVIDGFQDRGGFRAVEDLADKVSVKNKEAILDALAKCNIIIRLFESGFNLLQPIKIGKKDITPLEHFKKLDSNEILDWYNVQLTQMGGGYDVKLLEDADMEITDDFMDSLICGDEQGTSYDCAGVDIQGNSMSVFPRLSNSTLGFVSGASHYIAGFSSSGKTAMLCSIILALVYRGEKVLIICNEQSSKTWKINMLTFILYKHFRYTSITKSDLMAGKLSEEDRKMLNKAREYLNQLIKGNVHFIQMASNDMNVVKTKIRFYALQFGYSVVVYDTFKISDTNFRNKDVASWDHLVQASRDLDICAKQYDLIMLCSMQLAQSHKGALFLDSNMLSGAKGVVEQLDTLLCIRDVYKEELDPNSPHYCAPYEIVKNETTGKYEKRDFLCDPQHSWKMVFLSKSRNSENSTSSQSALMFKFLGQYAIFQEQCYGRPKHGYIQ